MDIVYVYKHWWGNWLELKYSLRSLVNINHNNVYIVWDKPDWAKNIIHIPVPDDKWSKYLNVLGKYRAICENENISENFVLMNDDMYIMEPITDIPYYIKWTLKEHIEYIKEKHWDTKYCEVINRVYKKYKNWLAFTVHCPIIYNKQKLKKLLDTIWDEEISIRSLYWNMYNVPYEKYNKNDISDCKVYLMDRKYNLWRFLSSDDSSVRNMSFIRFMNQRFPSKCKYEI